MASQQAEKAAELQDPEIRAALDRRVREEGETVVKGGTGGTSLAAQERLAEGTYINARPRMCMHVAISSFHRCVLPYV
jgi:hypothetical protein